MKKKTKPKTKRTPQNAELINKIKAVMLDGSGIRRRIEANLALHLLRSEVAGTSAVGLEP